SIQQTIQFKWTQI
ncbi:unnamed protein product, partial [Rotaria magnacalcarata]